jgi:hypothetical protein
LHVVEEEQKNPTNQVAQVHHQQPLKANESNSEVIIDKRVESQSEEEKVTQDELIIDDTTKKNSEVAYIPPTA